MTISRFREKKTSNQHPPFAHLPPLHCPTLRPLNTDIVTRIQPLTIRPNLRIPLIKLRSRDAELLLNVGAILSIGW